MVIFDGHFEGIPHEQTHLVGYPWHIPERWLFSKISQQDPHLPTRHRERTQVPRGKPTEMWKIYEQSPKLPNTELCIRWTLVFIKCKKTEVSDGTFPNSDTPCWTSWVLISSSARIGDILGLRVERKGQGKEKKRKRKGKRQEEKKKQERKRKRKQKGKEK